MNLLNPPSLNTAYYTASKYLHIISYTLLHTITHYYTLLHTITYYISYYISFYIFASR